MSPRNWRRRGTPGLRTQVGQRARPGHHGRALGAAPARCGGGGTACSPEHAAGAGGAGGQRSGPGHGGDRRVGGEVGGRVWGRRARPRAGPPPLSFLPLPGAPDPKAPPGCERLQESPGPREAESGLSDSDCKELAEERLDGPPVPHKAPGASPLGPCPAGRGPPPAGGEEPPPYRPPSAATGPPHAADLHPLLPAATGASVIHSPQQAALAKPKLWSLAEIATSADKAKEAGGEAAPPGPAVLGGSGPSRSPPRPRSPAAQCPFPNGAVLPRPLYYTAPFYPGYTNYGSFGALHGHPAGGPAAAAPGAHFNGLNQTVLSRAESLAKDTKMIRSQSQVDLCKDSPYELKKGMSNI